MRKLILRSAAVAFAFLGIAACTSGHETPPMDLVGQSFDPIVNGTKDSGTANDAVVMVYNQSLSAMCTGTLIAPNLVLTARHCVSSTTDMVDCNNDVISDTAATQLYIYKGVDPQTEVGRGKAVFHDTSKSLCGHDVSIIQTAYNITGITPIKVRVIHGPSPNELFKAIGYGETNPSNPNSSGIRYYRNSVKVLGTLQGTGCQGASDGCDFLGTESICSGDSGGPALSSQGAVMGVTSRGSNCYADENVWTRTDVFKWLFDQAATAAGTSYTGEDGTVYGSGGSGGTGGTGGSGGSTGGSGGSTGGSGGSTGGSGGSTGGAGGSTGGAGGSTGGAGGSLGGAGGSLGGAGGAVGGMGGGPGGDGGSGGTAGVTPGAPCGPNNDCAAGLGCVADFDGVYCAPQCGPNNECPTGWACATDNGYCFKNKVCITGDDCALGTVCAADAKGNYCTPLCSANNLACPADSTCSPELGACFHNPTTAANYDQSSTSSGCAFAVAGTDSDVSNGWWVPLLGLGAVMIRRRRRA